MKKMTSLKMLLLLIFISACAGPSQFVTYKKIGPYEFGKEEIQGDFDRYMIKKRWCADLCKTSCRRCRCRGG